MLAGLMVFVPSFAGNIAAVRPGWTVERRCSFGRVPVVMRIVGMRRVRMAKKERKNVMRVVRRVDRRGNRRAPIIIQVVVRKFEEITGFSMNFIREEGAERSLLILTCCIGTLIGRLREILMIERMSELVLIEEMMVKYEDCCCEYLTFKWRFAWYLSHRAHRWRYHCTEDL